MGANRIVKETMIINTTIVPDPDSNNHGVEIYTVRRRIVNERHIDSVTNKPIAILPLKDQASSRAASWEGSSNFRILKLMKKATVTRQAAANIGRADMLSDDREGMFALSRKPARMGPTTSVRLLVDWNKPNTRPRSFGGAKRLMIDCSDG